MKSLNTIILSGRLTADATINESGSRANFSIAHNFTSEKVAYVNFTMFNKNGNRKVEIPADLLKKGTAVEVKAYFYPDGDKGKYEFIARSVEPLAEEPAEDNAEEENNAE